MFPYLLWMPSPDMRSAEAADHLPALRVDIMGKIMANAFDARTRRAPLTSAIAMLMLGLAGADAHASSDWEKQLRAPYGVADTTTRKAHKLDGDRHHPKPAAQHPRATHDNCHRCGATRKAVDGETVWERLYRQRPKEQTKEQTKLREVAPHNVGRPLPWEPRQPKRVAKHVSQPEAQQHELQMAPKADLADPSKDIFPRNSELQPWQVNTTDGDHGINHSELVEKLQQYIDDSEPFIYADSMPVHNAISAAELGIDISYRLPEVEAIKLLLHVTKFQVSHSLTRSKASHASHATTVIDEVLRQYSPPNTHDTPELQIREAQAMKQSLLNEVDSKVVALIARVKFDEDEEPAYAVMRRSIYGDGWEAVSFDQESRLFDGTTVSKLISRPVEKDKIDAIEMTVHEHQPKPLKMLFE